MGTATLAQSLLYRGVSRPTLYSVKMPSRVGTIRATREREEMGTFFRRRNDGTFRLGKETQERIRTKGVDSTVNEYLDLFCKSITVPEGRIDVVQANGHEHMGITRETAQNFIYGKPLTMSVIENSDFTIYKAMRSWIESTGVGSRINQGRSRTIKMDYYDSYVADIEVIKYEYPNQRSLAQATASGRLTYHGYKTPIGWKFYNAYPILIGSLPLSTDAYNTALEFEIQFTYESYSVFNPLRRDND